MRAIRSTTTCITIPWYSKFWQKLWCNILNLLHRAFYVSCQALIPLSIARSPDDTSSKVANFMWLYPLSKKPVYHREVNTPNFIEISTSCHTILAMPFKTRKYDRYRMKSQFHVELPVHRFYKRTITSWAIILIFYIDIYFMCKLNIKYY